MGNRRGTSTVDALRNFMTARATCKPGLTLRAD
jgi:hypothetical protein